MATDAELQQKFTACDDDLTAMDKSLGEATERMGVHDYRTAQIAISAAHARLGHAGKTLAELHEAVLPAGGTPPTEQFTYPEPTQVAPASIPWGGSVRGYQADMTKITAMSFVAQQTGTVSLGVAEYGSPPTGYQSTISMTAGDMSGPSFSAGNQTYSSLPVSKGSTYYFNFRAWSGDIGPTATYPVQGVVVEGAWA